MEIHQKYILKVSNNKTFCTGKYNYQTTQATCLDCPAGKYCDPYENGNVTGIVTPLSCPAGYYCPLATGYNMTNPCPSGFYSPFTDLDAAGECWVIEISFTVNTEELKLCF